MYLLMITVTLFSYWSVGKWYMEMLTAEFPRKLPTYPTNSYNFLVYDNNEENKFIFWKFLNHLWWHSRITEKRMKCTTGSVLKLFTHLPERTLRF